jgi:hypothetical protein
MDVMSERKTYQLGRTTVVGLTPQKGVDHVVGLCQPRAYTIGRGQAPTPAFNLLYFISCSIVLIDTAAAVRNYSTSLAAAQQAESLITRKAGSRLGLGIFI